MPRASCWPRRSTSPARAGGRKPAGDYHRFLFGTTNEGGVIEFHDAWITPESLEQSALKLDVMTPHHPDHQRDPDDEKFKAPTDFDSPRPIPFLSVRGRFGVAVSWCGPTSLPVEQRQKWIDLAMTLLQRALADWGVGGKTSSGYGRLVDPDTLSSAAADKSQRPSLELPKSGDRIEAVLQEEKTKKAGWKAKHDASGLTGHIVNTSEVPPDRNPGDRLTLIVASINDRDICFRYPTTADKERAKKSQGKPKGGSEGRRPRGRI